MSERPPRRRRTGLLVRVGLLALLVVLVLFVPRHSRDHSTSLPAGGWGQTIRCLERNADQDITDTATGRVPTSATREVTVTSSVQRQTLAVIRREADAAAARAVVAHNGLSELMRSDYRVSGAIVWAYNENGTPPHVSANAGDRTLIAACVTDPRA